MKRIRRAPDGSYTMRSVFDGIELPLAQPPRFSTADRFAHYRYDQKREEWSDDASQDS
jgi:rRNA maturation protein Nop10